ncbi:hypothetical protein F0562_008861 [Nyssa sinensis]|uniref:Uncharacterized protein n=1 Tax=Nyssa sinensis TaxID=561372 RepID=A0A5J5A8S8_9ASTE|nr:hypothetical protein F0562_008861 [Nyssa sinensis]
MLVAAADEPSKQLNLIDAIQRLGVFYHFENQIDAALQLIYDTYHACDDKDNDDLYTVALWFRLLRQQGHYVSCDLKQFTIFINAHRSWGYVVVLILLFFFEQKGGHVASAIECYKKQYDASKQQAHEEFQKQVADAWKVINGECLRPTDVPIALLTRVINLARVIDVIYKGDDGYTHIGT